MQSKHRLVSYVKPERYEIMLKPDLEGFSFEGEETIYLHLAKSTKEIILHCAELKIVCEGAKVKYDKKSETVTLVFPKAIQKGKAKLKLKFTGILNDKMRGFYRSKYIHEGKEKHLATTQFESTDARRSFPCFDEPSQKAIFDITLMITSGLKAISNTIESEVLEHESGYQIIKFAPTPKMSTYLLAFIVGDFEYIENKTKDDILVRVFTTPGKKDQAKFALDVAIKCLEFYNNYFGIDYPLPVLDMIAIPDFAAGAMENWGAVTYRESTILIDDEKSSSANKQWVALVIAHELAHQWFGNLVTMEWWTHLWLNEGFASFIEYLAIDHIFPDWDIWTQFVSTEMSDAFALDALSNTHPIEVEVGHPAEISEIFDRVSYSKGASVLRMLWKYLGEKDFQKGLQYYLKKYAYGNAQTQDLWLALEKASKKPVGKIMKNWTGKPGHPVITVSGKGKGVRGKLELTQSRFFSSPISKRKSKDNTVWSIPLSSLRGTSGASDVAILLMDKKSISIPNTGAKLNIGETSLVRVDYPEEYLKGLEKNINQLSAPDRLGLIRDSFDLAQSGNSPTILALELARSYENEEDYTVWSTLTGHLNQLDSLLAYESFYDDYKNYNRYLYNRIAQKMGWEKKPGEKHTDSLLRSMVLYKLGSFGDEETIKKAQELFSLHTSSRGAKLRGDLDSNKDSHGMYRSGASLGMTNLIDPDLRGVVYNLVAENGGQQEWNTLVKMYKAEDNQQEKDRLGRSLGLFKDKKLLQKALEFAISKDVRFQNSLGVIASVWHNPMGRYPAWEFVKLNWKMLKERYAGGHYFTRVFGSAGEFTRNSDAKDIERFTKKNPIPEAQRTISQALEQIYSNVEWLKNDKQKIRIFLEKFKPEDS